MHYRPTIVLGVLLAFSAVGNSRSSCKETLDIMATLTLLLCSLLGSVSLVYGQPLCELISN